MGTHEAGWVGRVVSELVDWGGWVVWGWVDGRIGTLEAKWVRWVVSEWVDGWLGVDGWPGGYT